MGSENVDLKWLRWWLTLSREERRNVPGVYGDLGDFAPNLQRYAEDEAARQQAEASQEGKRDTRVP